MDAQHALVAAAASLSLAARPFGRMPEGIGVDDDQPAAVAILCLAESLGDDDLMDRLALADEMANDLPAFRAWFADPEKITLHPRRLTRLLFIVAGLLARFIEADHGVPASVAAAEAFERAYEARPKAA